MAFLSGSDLNVRISTKSDASGVDDTRARLSNLESTASGVSTKTSGMTGAFVKAGLALEAIKFAADLASKAVGAVWGFGQEAIKSAAAYEQSAIAFETMLGSADAARKMLREVSAFAAKTPFELPELIDTTKRLLAYNVAAEDIIPTLTNLGNITAGIGRDKMPQLVLAYGQVRAATRLTGAELRQFTEAGVPLIQTLADQFGVTQGRILEMVSAGQIGFKDVETAFASMSGEGGKFFGLMEKQSKTYDGVISNLRDNFGQMAREIVGISNDGTIREGSIFQTLANRARDLLHWVDENKETIQEYASILMDRLVNVLNQHVMPAIEKFGRKFLDYITSDQFERDLQTVAGIVSGITRSLDAMATHAERTRNAINTVNTIQSYTPAGLIGSGIRKLFGFADGGFTGRGLTHEVAGVVHKGEYVVPKHQVDQNTGMPKAMGRAGVTIENFHMNVQESFDLDFGLNRLDRTLAARLG